MGILPYYCCVSILFTYPLLIATFSTMNPALMNDILKSQDAQVMILYGTSSIIGMCLSCPDIRMVFFIQGWFEALKCAFADACPAKVRLAVGRGSMMTWISFLIFMYLIYYDEMPDLKPIHIFEMYTSADLALLSGTTYLLFLGAFIFKSQRSPSDFTILKSNITSVKLEKNKANILREQTSDALSNSSNSEK